MSPGALPGFRDFYPAEHAQRAHIFSAWRDVARRYGFAEYDGPPLEPLELYTRKSGEEIVGQLYNFTDKGGREISLRPEMTPTLARMVAARANALRKPVRWFSIPQLFRYERQQRGRLREHFQLNMDIVGEPDETADAELLAAAIDIMRVLGLGPEDVVARVSDRRLLDHLLVAAGVVEGLEWMERNPGIRTAIYAAIDKIARDPHDVLAHRLRTAGLGEAGIANLFAMLEDRSLEAVRKRLENDDVGRRLVERFDRYLQYLDALGVGAFVRFDLSIVRGLAYYTGIVFELFDVRGELRAICGGGRYDNLLEALGGVSLPALGFGMGDVVLGELLRDRGLLPDAAPAVDVWVAYADPAHLRDAMRAAARLRQRGRSVEYALGGQKLARQLKAASAAGARDVAILGAPDTAAGEVVVRRLADGAERRLPLDEWIDG